MKLNFRIALLVGIGLAGYSLSVFAHHSLSAEFDLYKQMQLTGVITRVEWGNPHALFFIDVRDAQTAKVVSWALQLPSPNTLARRGWIRDELKSGTVVTVNSYPAKDGSRKGSVRDITSDGRKLLAAF